MHRLHKYASVFWRYILMNTVTEVEDVASPAETRQYSRHFFFDTGRLRIEHGRIHVATERHFVPTRRRASAISVVQSRPSASQPVAAIASSH